MSRQAIKHSLDQYHRARLCFVQTVSNYADKMTSVVYLHDMNVIDLLLPLLSDKLPSVQHAALATLGKMVCSNQIDARSFMQDRDLISRILHNLTGQNKQYKKTALHILACMVQNDEGIAGMIADQELENIVECLKDTDTDTRVNAALALGGMAETSEDNADRIVQAGALPPLTHNILASPELSLKRAAAFALTHIAEHNEVLAENVSQCNTIPLLIKALHNTDWRIKANALLCLAAIAKHSPSLATSVAENVTDLAVQNLSDPHVTVHKNAAILIQCICKNNLHLANLVWVAGGVEGLLGLVQRTKGGSCLAAITALGYMAMQSEQIAEHILHQDGIYCLQAILMSDNIELQEAAAWTLGEIGKHSVENVEKLCQENVLSTLLSKITESSHCNNLKSVCSEALMLLIPNCENNKELERILLSSTSEELLSPVLCAFAKILPCSSIARRSFVTSQCLRKSLDMEETFETAPCLKIIKACFPEEVIQIVSPNYLEDLINRMEGFSPRGNADMPSCASLFGSASSMDMRENNMAEPVVHTPLPEVNQD